MQARLGMDGKVTRILVDADPGKVEAVRSRLVPIAASFHLALGSADAETGLLKEALGPSDLTSGSSPRSRRCSPGCSRSTPRCSRSRSSASTLRSCGSRATPRPVLRSRCASRLWCSRRSPRALGLAAGSLLAATLFDQTPGYLAPAFVPGSRTVVQWWPAAVAVAGAIVAALVASGPVLLDLRSRELRQAGGHDAASGQDVPPRARLLLTIGAIGSLALGTALLAAVPRLALAAAGLLAVATVLSVPLVLAGFAQALRIAAERAAASATSLVALFAVRATVLRNTALAATGAVAVFGVVAVAGSRDDLLSGIDAYANDYVSTADVWVVNPNDNQATNLITIPDVRRRVAAVPGVAGARAYTGSFLDEGNRRLWIIGRDQADRKMLPPSQVLAGDLAAATRAVRKGDAVAVSDAFARDRGLGLGDTLTLDTPTGRRSWPIAALTTNLGWTPGAVIMSRDAYQRAWATATPTAIEVDIRDGADTSSVQTAIQQALGPDAGVVVQASAERRSGIEASARQGLRQLQQISALLLGGAVLALATAMGAAISRRRVDLAKLAVDGWRPIELWQILLIEAAVVLAAGCFAGMVLGTWGQVAADKYIRTATGFPVEIAPGGWTTAGTFAAVIGGALLLVAIPSWRASRVKLAVGLRS